MGLVVSCGVTCVDKDVIVGEGCSVPTFRGV